MMLIPFSNWIEELKTLARFLQPFFLEPPPRTEATGLAGLLEVLRVGRRFRGLKGRQISELITFLTGSLEQFLDRYFESEEIKRLILANNLYGKHGGPRDPGSAMGLLFHLLSGGEEEQAGFQRPRDWRHGRHNPGHGGCLYRGRC